MSVRWQHEATDCSGRSTDWTAIGARILQTAAMASAVHMAERWRATQDREATESLFVPDGEGTELTGCRADREVR